MDARSQPVAILFQSLPPHIACAVQGNISEQCHTRSNERPLFKLGGERLRTFNRTRAFRDLRQRDKGVEHGKIRREARREPGKNFGKKTH